MPDTALEKRITTTPQAERVRSGRTYIPAVDIVEKEDELLLLADVPGTVNDGIDIRYERGLLTLTARVEPRQAPQTNYLAREYGVGDFVRTFEIGESIDAGRIHAELSAGVLTLHLPQAKAAKARRIEVKAR